MKIQFGRYRGCDTNDVARDDPQWFQWALKNVSGFADALRDELEPESKQIPIRSSCGHGHIKNAGFPKPGSKVWTRR